MIIHLKLFIPGFPAALIGFEVGRGGGGEELMRTVKCVNLFVWGGGGRGGGE